MDLSKYTINITSSVREVLEKISALVNIQTVFVINNNNEVIGSITDGDIRRGFLKGFSIDDNLEHFLFKDFRYIKEGESNFDELKEFRKKKIKAIPLLSKENKLVKIIDFSNVKSLLPLDAVIMAGGLGSRLKPLTNKTPKPLLKIGEKEIVSYNFDRLYQYGVDNQHITINYLGEQIEDFCTSYNDKINFHIVHEKKFMGTAGSLSLIDNFENDVVLLMNSDLLTNIDYEDFYKSFIEKEADMMVASISYPVNLPYAIFELENSNIKSFKEKPNYTYYANAGIYLIKKELLSLIPKETFFNATDLMELMIESGKKLMHYPIRGYWLDIGKHEDYEKAQKDITHINWD
jgi:dTDP-glucose pyrophosphorylase